MNETGAELVARLHREAIEAGPVELPPVETVPLPEEPASEELRAEWALFRKELPGLLEAGHRGRIALVKVGHPVTVWSTMRDAIQAARLLGIKWPCLVQPVQTSLPTLRRGYQRPCQP
jgi:hypothetical protein